MLGILFALMSWVIESLIHSRFFYAQPLDFWSSLLRPDRHELWMRCIIFVLFVSFGFYARKVVKDLQEARETVTKINRELTQIFDTAADGMRVISCDFTILRANSTFLRLAGMGAGEVIGQKCYDVFSGESCHTERCPMHRMQNGAERLEYDSVKMRVDGRAVPCIVTATPFYDSHRRLVGLVEDFKDISERKQTEEALRHSHARLRLVTSHLEIMRERERRAISREIHDELGQNLTGLKMDLCWLIRNLHRGCSGLKSRVQAMDSLLDRTIQSVRRISSEIRPALLDDLGLQAAIEAEAEKVADRLGIRFDIVCQPEDIELDDQYRNTIYRIFKEALTNIVRHAEASRVMIRLMQDSGRITLTISDNGRGITEEQKRGNESLGLVSMQERAWLLDGTLRIFGDTDRGTTVYLTLPCPITRNLRHVENIDG